MPIEKFVSKNEFLYRTDVGDTPVRYHIGDTEEMQMVAYHLKTETPVLEDVVDCVGTDDVFLDVGANLGVYSAAVGAAGATPVAVEPVQQNMARTRRNLERNCEDWNVLPFAMGDERKLTRMETDEIGMADTTASIGDGRLTVPMLPGDEAVANYVDGVPNVVKIDVEGAEGLVIAGLEETLRDDRCRRIYLELHTNALLGDETPESVRSRLSEYGFELSTPHERVNPRGERQTEMEFLVGTK